MELTKEERQELGHYFNVHPDTLPTDQDIIRIIRDMGRPSDGVHTLGSFFVRLMQRA